MTALLRIGTRSSKLAIYQAEKVATLIENLGVKTTLKKINSKGDLNTHDPLHSMGMTGIFTKALDDAMLAREIDIAVHSFKDVPTDLPNGIVQAAVLKRHKTADVLVYKNTPSKKMRIIATGSLRRKTQWLYRYPKDTVVDLRGNINTRLQKLKDNHWDGAIFAQAGLERIGLLNGKNYDVLDWMIPAPAQGAMMVTTLKNNQYARVCCKKFNHRKTEICTAVERAFMKTLEGGCTAPIGAKAEIVKNNIKFKGVLTDLKGKEQIAIEKNAPIEAYEKCGTKWALELLENKGGRKLLKKIKNSIY